MKRLMIVRYVLPLMLLLTFGLLAGSGMALAAGTYTNSDNGKTITASSGDTFTIRLDENPTTGYSWNMTVGNGLQPVSDRYVANQPQLMGSGGYHEWTIKAVRPGTHVISGIYRRPWEPVTGSEQRFKLTVRVIGSAGGYLPSFKLNFDKVNFMPAKMSVPDFGSIFKSITNIFGAR